MMKILIAEDDFTSRSILQVVLTKWGYEVVCAADGNEAWKILEEATAPQLCLVDWMMPGMDGLDLCRKVRSLKTTTLPYLILLTSRNGKGEIVQGLQAGADDYITKPFDNEELCARIEVGRRLIEMQKALLEQEKMRGVLEMAGTICHEFNQPLQVISGNVELMTMTMQADNPLQHKIKLIREQVARLSALTRKVMLITKYEAREYVGGRKIIDLDRAAKY